MGKSSWRTTVFSWKSVRQRICENLSTFTQIWLKIKCLCFLTRCRWSHTGTDRNLQLRFILIQSEYVGYVELLSRRCTAESKCSSVLAEKATQKQRSSLVVGWPKCVGCQESDFLIKIVIGLRSWHLTPDAVYCPLSSYVSYWITLTSMFMLLAAESVVTRGSLQCVQLRLLFSTYSEM